MKTIAGRYQLTVPIGRGGMGQLWRGVDLPLNRPVAVKLIDVAGPGSRDDTRRRFYREARITARLRHPGVPVVYDYGDDGDLFLVMELLGGDSIGTLKDEQGALPVAWVAFIGAQVCAVLAAAHGAGLVHRDLKPENLLLCRDGTVKVVDFGIAVSLAPDECSKITQSGEIPGSARYMAPELIQGAAAGRASDLYTLGCVLYELLTGARPYESRDLLREIARGQTEAPPPVTGAPAELEELILRLLDKDPGRRPDSAVAVYEALAPWARKPPPLPGWVAGDLAADPVVMYSAIAASLLP